MRAMVRSAVLAAVAAAAIGAAPAPQNPAVVAAARQAGVIGERYDGYMGFVATPTAEMRRQVGAVNLRRRTLYIGLAGAPRRQPERGRHRHRLRAAAAHRRRANFTC